jgi:hypothetical protein
MLVLVASKQIQQYAIKHWYANLDTLSRSRTDCPLRRGRKEKNCAVAPKDYQQSNLSRQDQRNGKGTCSCTG